jgi:hypothetical protein
MLTSEQTAALSLFAPALEDATGGKQASRTSP